MSALRPYPIISDITERPEIHGVFSYIIYGYQPGISILIKFHGSEIGVIAGDWQGRPFTATDPQITAILGQHVPKLAVIMKAVNFGEGQFFFSADGSLVDVQLGESRFMGAGMLRDLFSKQFITQRVIGTDVLSEEKIDQIRSDKSKYPVQVIVKSSRYRSVEVTSNHFVPCYATI